MGPFRFLARPKDDSSPWPETSASTATSRKLTILYFGAAAVYKSAVFSSIASHYPVLLMPRIFDNIDFTDPDLLDDNAAIAEVLTLCGIDFERLLEAG